VIQPIRINFHGMPTPRRNIGARAARARARPSSSAGACDASFATAAALVAPANRSFLISAGWLSHHNKLRARGAVGPSFAVFLGSEYRSETVHGRAWRRARTRLRLRPGRIRHVIRRSAVICLAPQLVCDTPYPKSGPVKPPRLFTSPLSRST